MSNLICSSNPTLQRMSTTVAALRCLRAGSTNAVRPVVLNAFSQMARQMPLSDTATTKISSSELVQAQLSAVLTANTTRARGDSSRTSLHMMRAMAATSRVHGQTSGTIGVGLMNTLAKQLLLDVHGGDSPVVDCTECAAGGDMPSVIRELEALGRNSRRPKKARNRGIIAPCVSKLF